MLGIEKFPDFVKELPQIDFPFAGVTGWLIQGGRQQVVLVEFDEDVDVPEHSHEEQWEIVVSGSVRLHMGGKETEYEAGETFFVPAGIPHAASVRAGYRAVIVFNEPDRYQAVESGG